MLTLHSYFRSSAAYRVRIALNLKGLAHHIVPVHLLRDGGQQLAAEFRAINPAGLVPVLTIEPDAAEPAQVLTQSLAIIEYLEETHPQPPLLPTTPAERAWVRGLALNIACDIHPLNNLRVLKYLTQTVGASEDAKNAWYQHWVETGLECVETMLMRRQKAGLFCHGDAPGLADCCLVPQVANALRTKCRTGHLPVVMGIYQRCMGLPAFIQAAPEQQPDAERPT